MVHEDVRSDDVLDSIEDLRVVDELVRPVEEQVGLRLLGKLDRMHHRGLVSLETGPALRDLIRTENRDRLFKQNRNVSFEYTLIGQKLKIKGLIFR